MSGEGSAGPSITGAIPPGWYPDPAGGAGKRWWDGSRWTDNIQEPEPVAPAATFGNYVPAEFRPVQPIAHAERGIGYTRASWWLAGSPIWVVVPQAIVFEIFNALAPPPISAAVIGFGLLTLLAWAILIALAFADRAALYNGGNDTVASPWWTLLTPLAYLIARARHVQLYASGGWASVVWWVIAAVVTPGLAVLGVFAAYGIFAN
jgi:hypothetical protein